MKDSQIQYISKSILNLALQFAQIDQHTHFYGTDVEIYPTEIHLISEIAMNPGIHVMGLANLRGVTKGTISQMIQKLEKKGLLEKKVSKSNQSKLSLYVTEKGQFAHEYHMAYHKKLDTIMESELKTYTEPEIETISTFLSKTMQNIKAMEEKL